MDNNLYIPFKFNHLKHHLSEVISFVEQQKGLNHSQGFTSKLKMIGENVIDIYIGNLSVNEILTQIRTHLISEEHFEYPSYKLWFVGNDFRKLTITDNSVWILRNGFDKESYIHIHPGKHSPHTFRTNSNALKTAVCFYYFFGSDDMSLDVINKIRKEYLDLSPVKTIDEMNKCRLILKMIRKEITKNM